jgi:hypothetical protein
LTAGTLSAGSSTLKVNFTGLAWTGVEQILQREREQLISVVSLKHWQQLVFNNLIFSNTGLKH